MGKKLSIEDLIKKMESERLSKIEERKSEDQRLIEMAERQRKEILRIRSLYEKRPIVGGFNSGGSLPTNTPTLLNGRSTIVLYKFGGTLRYFIYEFDNDFFSEEVDTGVPDTYSVQFTTDISSVPIPSVQDSGYFFTLRGSGENIIFFIDSQGRLVQKVTVPDSERWTSNVTGWLRLTDGKFVFAVTNIGNNYTIHYFDGLKYYKTTVTADSVFLPDPYSPSSGSGVQFPSGGDEFGSSTTLDVKLLWYYTIGNNRTYRLSGNGNDLDFITYDTTIGTTRVYCYTNGNFITVYNRNVSNIYQWFKIYDTSGNIIINEDVSSLNSNLLSWDNYGTDKSWFVFETGTTYKVYICDNSNQTMVSTTQTSNRWDVSYRTVSPTKNDTSGLRNISNYRDLEGGSTIGPMNYPYQIGLSKAESILFSFYNYGVGAANGFYKNVTDCTFVPRFQTESGPLRVINYVSGGDEYLTVGVRTTTSSSGKGGWLNTYTLSNDAIFIDGYENTGGDPFLKKFIITPTGSSTVTSTIDKLSTYLYTPNTNTNPSFKKRYLGDDKLLYQYRTSTGTRSVIFNIDGTQDAAQDFNKTILDKAGISISNTNFVIARSEEGGDYYYYTPFSGGFVNLISDSITYQGGGLRESGGTLPDYEPNGVILISDNDQLSGTFGKYRIITKDSISNINQFPFIPNFSTNPYTYGLTYENLIYVYNNSSGFVNIVMADFSGNTIHSVVTTTDTRFDQSYLNTLFYNRVYILTDTGNNTPATSYMVDFSGITTFSTVPKGTSFVSLNDYRYWGW